jgi:DNA-binding ferritin-like protein
MKKLMSMLKVIPDNVRVLHRNLIGAGWFADHKELGKIYDALDGVADDVMEIAISLGNQEPSLAEAAAEYESIGGRAYTNEQVWGMVRAMLLDLHEELGAQEGKVPGDVWNKLEEHQYYLNKLANYKIGQRLKGEQE